MDEFFPNLSPDERKKIRELEQELEIKTELLAELEAKSKESKDLPKHKQKELEQENLMFKELLENIEGITEAEIDQFFSMVSHELKTPLVPVQGYVKMLKDEHLGKLKQIQKEKLAIIDSSTTSLINLIQNMLDYQKLASGKMEMIYEKSSVRKIIDNALLAFESEFLRKEIQREVYLAEKIDLECDPKRITQVISHLIDNSLKSVEKNTGKVWINAIKRKEEVKISIRDNGSGIPKNLLDKVFTKFYQLDMSNTREKGGIGLGLSICKKIVEAHKGRIWAESEERKGTTINITLPLK